MPSTTEISIFVLAGGKSSRMGRDKAWLELDGTSLLERALALARSLTERVAIVGNSQDFAHLAPVVPDIYLGRGPLGGIHAALLSSTTDLNLILAVDMPFIESAFLDYLAELASRSSEWVIVPRAEGRLQPLCAVYRKAFATRAQTALTAGHNKIDTLFEDVPTKILEEAQWVPLGFSPAMFRNLNTPEDLTSARRKRL